MYPLSPDACAMAQTEGLEKRFPRRDVKAADALVPRKSFGALGFSFSPSKARHAKFPAAVSIPAPTSGACRNVC